MLLSKANGLLDGCRLFCFCQKRAAARNETDFPHRATSGAAALVSHKGKKKNARNSKNTSDGSA